MNDEPCVVEGYILCGLEVRAPDVIKIVSAGCERRQAIQMTLYRQAGDSDEEFLWRAWTHAQALNLRRDEFDPFSGMLGGTILFRYADARYAEKSCSDDLVNARFLAMHKMSYSTRPEARLNAASRLAKLVGMAPSGGY